MEAQIAVCVHDMTSGSGVPKATSVSGNTINFSAPPALREANFPVTDTSFNVEKVVENPNGNRMVSACLSGAASAFNSRRENLVVFGFGVRSTPKRQLMLGSGSDEGYAAKVIGDAVSGGKGIFSLSCFVIGQEEHLHDLINPDNELGVIVESVKEGPRVRMVERVKVTSAAEVRSVLKKVEQSYKKYFAAVLPEKQPTPELEALPPYNGDTVMLQLFRYESEEGFTNYEEVNSMNFICLADAERPVLCGVDPTQQETYEKAHRVLLSAAGVVSSIKCSRLRIPFGKSKMTQLLRRCYNAEKGYEANASNGPTNTYFFVHCFTDGKWAEETFHNLSMIRRITNTLGSTGIGSMLRDLPADKWRLDQDVAELRDELVIAKTVYEYKPSIFEAAKPVVNIKEEELKRITAIQAKRDEAREKQLVSIRQRAKEEAAALIKQQEASSGTTLAELEKTLAAKKRENAQLQSDRDARTKDYEQTLEKIRKKKEDEEATAEKLKEEMAQLEEELTARQAAIQSKQKQLEMARLDKAKGREAVMRERESVQAARKSILSERRQQREQWIRQIKDINAKVLEQIKSLASERKQNGETVSAKEEAAERAVVDDIKTTGDYLPKLISLEDTPVNPEETENIRRQFDDVFAQEKTNYQARIEEEKTRKEKLEKGLEAYRNRVLEAAQAKKNENMQDAVKKEQHLNNLVEQVLTYLRLGVKMSKISSKGHIRRRFYFVSEDCKRIHSCELDSQGAPINRRKPPVTIWMRDIRKVILGVYTGSFTGFSSETQLAKARAGVISDRGTFRHDPTQSITPANLGLYNYRSFALLLKGGKSLEVVCDSDSDCEAWLVGLKRLLNIRTPIEKVLEQRIRPGQEVIPSDPDQPLCEMKFGGVLDIRNMHGFVSLSAEEGILCSENHIPPALLLRVKQEIIEKSHNGPMTVYDVRVSSGMDLIRCSYVYNYLAERRLIPLPF